MSERATMKRRVRGLLHNNWLPSLGAVALAFLPMLVVCLLVVWLVMPVPGSISGGLELSFSVSDPRSALLQLLMMFMNPGTLFEPLLGYLPTVAILLAMHLFVGLPICVSLASYFLLFLRGRKPRVLNVYDSFSGKYPRALGGTAYMLLWQLIWFCVSFVVPTIIVFISVPFVSSLGIELAQQIYAFAGILIGCILWYIVFFVIFCNKMLAYSLTPVCLAAQPRLPARQAVRLSRKLMRGSKWRLIGLFASFLNYFIPAIAAVVLLPLLPHIGPLLGLSEIMQRSLRTFLWVVVFANQLAWVYVAPYLSACFHAFYIERKREALMDEEVTPEDFGSTPKQTASDFSAKAE